MSGIVKFPGGGLTTKKAGTALVRVTANGLHVPLQIASACRNEFRCNVLRHLNDGDLAAWQLPSAKHNHAKMLPRAALVDATHTALLSVVVPHLAPPISPDAALTMLSALFGPLGKKGNDNAALLDACISMLHPDADVVGEATELWLPIPKSPVIVALAVKRLLNNAIFAPMPAEFRRELREANRSVKSLADYAERWLALLHNADRIVFEHDRDTWTRAYENLGADVAATMQDRDEAGDVGDDGEDSEDIAPSPRWAALEAMRRAKRIE